MEDDGYLIHGLCPACFSIDINRADLSYEPRPAADIIACCKIGCSFCGLPTFSLDLKWCIAESKNNSILSVSLSGGDEHNGPEIQDCIVARLYFNERCRRTETFDTTVLRGEYEEDAILPLAPPTTTPESRKQESILERSFYWVDKQLDECTASHLCGGTSEMPLPTRVIDLSDGEGPDVRLLVPEQGAKGKYAALSYCWGHSNNFLLTPATMANLKNGFSICQLPKTLQDAVKVTRHIGLRYLWVDALCIIQGKDTEAINDWNTEVSQMDTVYSNAFITISAGSAQNASGGLFRGSNCDLPILRSWTFAGDAEVNLWVRVTWRNHSPGFKSEPINSRAWALQEDLLSTRVLFYASFGLLWKCNKELTWAYSGESRRRRFISAREEGDPKTSGASTKLLASTSRYMSTIPRDLHLAKSSQRIATSWQQKLELYTARNLTNPHDKLPAFAAIAQRYSRCICSEYLAGLWKSTFRQDLLWRRPPSYPLITVPDEGNPMQGDDYRAPSWSWAAVDGVVLNEWSARTPETPQWLAEVTVYPRPVLIDPRNPFGGIVKLSVQLQMRGPIETFEMTKGRPGTWTLFLDDFTDSAAWRRKELDSILCLHILAVPGLNCKSGYALALLPVPEQKDTYLRIGIATLHPDSTSAAHHYGDVTIQTVTIL